MSSVTKRIKEVKQPRGGYIKPALFETIQLDDKIVLEDENLHATIIGLVVDYMTRFMMGHKAREVFQISISGYERCITMTGIEKLTADMQKKVDAESYIERIKGLDDESIIAACKLCTYDVWHRNCINALLAKNAEETNPDRATINNIRVMVERSIQFWKNYGPIKEDGFTFEGGYTQLVTSGDGDYLTEDTLWDFKVSKAKLTNKQTLQLLMYWIMGQHSQKEMFQKIHKIGVFNPRLNMVYVLDLNQISTDIIREVESKVIGYEE